MVRAFVIASAVFALVATASAGLVDVDVDDYIGTGDINAAGLGREVVDLRGTEINNILNDAEILSGGHGHGGSGGSGPNHSTRPALPCGNPHPECGGGSHGGLLGGLLKREEPVASGKHAKKVNLRNRKMRMAKKMQDA